MDHTAGLLVAGLIAAGVCLFACYALRHGWMKAKEAHRRRHVEDALRAEVTRGLAELERFLEGGATPLPPGEFPDGGESTDS